VESVMRALASAVGSSGARGWPRERLVTSRATSGTAEGDSWNFGALDSPLGGLLTQDDHGPRGGGRPGGSRAAQRGFPLGNAAPMCKGA
jgi:hypothetical protein